MEDAFIAKQTLENIFLWHTFIYMPLMGAVDCSPEYENSFGFEIIRHFHILKALLSEIFSLYKNLEKVL